MREDGDSIDGDLLRRVPDHHIKKREVPHHRAYTDDASGYMSVAIADDLVAGGKEPTDLLDDHPGFGLVAIAAEDLRALGLEVVWKPEPGFPEHAGVYGEKTLEVRSAIGAAARWVFDPRDVADSTE